jgi:hypothetical protein
MTLTLADVREALATDLRTIPDVNADAYLVSHVRSPVHAMIDVSAEYDITMARGGDTYPLVVQVYVQRSDEIAAQRRLDQLRDGDDTMSIKAVLEAGTCAGLAGVSYVRVWRAGRTNLVDVGAPGVQYLMAEWECEVVA